MPAFFSAARTTDCCAGPFGTVRPLLRPSLLTALPRTTARIRSPSATASESRFRTTTPTPSLRTKPSARESNVLQRPSGAIMPHFEKHTYPSGESSTFTPPARARFVSPVRRLVHARCSATSDEEHAVSTATAGPLKPSVYDTRPATTFIEQPVA